MAKKKLQTVCGRYYVHGRKDKICSFDLAEKLKMAKYSKKSYRESV